MQGLALVALVFDDTMAHYIILSSLLDWGTAMVYPTFLASVAENTHPSDMANSLGVFRFWRDLGYAIGAILTGIIADTLGINASVLLIGLLTLSSAIIIFYLIKCLKESPIKISYWIGRKVKTVKGSGTGKQLPANM